MDDAAERVEPARAGASTRDALAEGVLGARAAHGPQRVIMMTPAEDEVARQMQICNACRYCEGYCAVFPAMTRRLDFAKADIHYLANLCHHCGACYHACQYAPPHEFAVNVPRALASVRAQTYAEYAWPAPLGALYRRNGWTVAVALAAGLSLLLVLATSGRRLAAPLGADFYAVLSHNAMALMFGAVFGFSALALSLGLRRFWRDVRTGPVSASAVVEATRHALALTHLGGGHGQGCNESDDRYTLARRWFHHATFYGFALCFASTSVATLYDVVLGWHAPYPPVSAPVVLGTLGGIGLLVGVAGLLGLNLRRAREPGDPRQRPMDRAFMALLLLTSSSGLALLVWRSGAAMPSLLALHLGVVMALFATLPYGKFAHAGYRCAALLNAAVERRQPDRLKLGGD